MISDAEKRSIINKLRSRTASSIQKQQYGKIPILIPDIELTNSTDISLVNTETDEEYTDYNVEDEGKWTGPSYDNDLNGIDEVVTFYSDITNSKKYNIIACNKYHYNNRWYGDVISIDSPETSFGILRIDNMPYKPFKDKVNKSYFMERLDKLIYQNHIAAIMLFVDGVFVPWSDIIVVYDAGTTYVLLFGEKYNYDYISGVSFSMIILPFKVACIEKETDYQFTRYYNAYIDYLTNNSVINNGKLYITLPEIDESYEYKGLYYNLGFWMYLQFYRYDGKTPEDTDRFNKLRNITISKFIYDENGIILRTFTAKFNMLDKDNYDMTKYEELESYFTNSDGYSKVLFRFNSDNLLTLNDSDTAITIYSLDSTVLCEYDQAVDSVSYKTNTSIPNNSIYADNCILFRNGMYKYSYRDFLTIWNNNTYKISNSNEDTWTIFYFASTQVKKAYNIDYNFNHLYYDSLSSDAMKDLYADPENPITEYIDKCTDLDYTFSDNEVIDLDSIIDTVIRYDQSALLDLFNTSMDTTVLTGTEANACIDNGYFTVHRNTSDKSESFCIVFVNGELMSTYGQMIVNSNAQYIPCDGFNDSDTVDLLYFNNCNNNIYKTTATGLNYESIGDLRYELIPTEDLKIFNVYPINALRYNNYVSGFSLTKNSDVAYCISEYNPIKKLNEETGLTEYEDHIDILNNSVRVGDVLYLMSKHRFVYQSFNVTQKSYRLRMNEKRFLGCDNQRQYLLFINGRRVDDSMFLITIPKYTRPFDRMYLYSTTFVDVGDKVELFYVPVEMTDLNSDNNANIKENGYIECTKGLVKVPFNNKNYILFANGKKIPNTDFINIGTSTFRLTKNIDTLNNLIIDSVVENTVDEITTFNKSATYSTIDTVIKYIISKIGYSELDKLYAQSAQIYDGEENMSNGNVGQVAILNEVIRDWWVANGFDYNSALEWIYDYELSGYELDINNKLVLPAMDANQNINIDRDSIRLLYLKLNGISGGFLEIGSKLVNPTLSWEYNDIYGRSPLASQSLIEPITETQSNETPLSLDLREYILNDTIDSERSYKITASSEDGYSCYKTLNIKFVNGIYYGMVDEDSLQHFKATITINDVDGLFAESDNATYTEVAAYNPDTGEIEYTSELLTLLDESKQEDMYTQNSANPDFVEYKNITYLDQMIENDLTQVLQDTIELNLTNYLLEENKYFVFMAPKSLLYDDNGKALFAFYMPTISYIINANMDDPSDDNDTPNDNRPTPVYTSGEFDRDNTLVSLKKMTMEILCEFEYTNKTEGQHKEKYIVFRSNGFFTRLISPTKVNIHVKQK